ncbi:hypothetical protein GCM10010398_14970 [Streptomyces fimbriatus]
MSRASQARRHDTTTPQGPRVLLGRHGLRCTLSRLRVLTLLSASDLHLSITEVCEQLTRAGGAVHPTTVYRTLETLTAVGVTHAVYGPGPTRYGITGDPHHHTVCQQCGMSQRLQAST